MVTYTELFTFCLVVIAVIELSLRLESEVATPAKTGNGYSHKLKTCQRGSCRSSGEPPCTRSVYHPGPTLGRTIHR